VIETASGSAWYVYGVVRVDDAAAVPGVDVVSFGGLAALVGAVSLDEFGEDVLPTRLNDREWLEEKARAHEEVLLDAAASSPVVPLRFGTIYRDRTEVEALLHDRAEYFADALGRVDGRCEIGVKAWAAPPTEERAAAAPGGRAYLEERRAQRQRAEAGSVERSEVAADAHRRLLAVSEDGVVNRPQPRELTGRSETMILNGAYLVRRGDTAAADQVARLQREYEALGYTFELTGPWPPHNFVDVEDAE
jgi:hypothetical protein